MDLKNGVSGGVRCAGFYNCKHLGKMIKGADAKLVELCVSFLF